MGDPCTAPNFIEIIKLIRKKNPSVLIKISTNGGMKNELFWIQLAESLGAHSEVIFAIDGLEDTNHIYRMNVNYKKVMNNSQAFINAGGNASWQFIVFKHNQHQVEKAKEDSKRIGFANFITVPSHRFNLDVILGRRPTGTGGVLIEPPTDKKYVHTVMEQPLKKLDVKQWLDSSETSEIACYAQKDRSIYIDSQGNIFPCCFLGASLYSRVTLDIPDGWDELYATEGKQSNLYTMDWDDIIYSMFFTKIQESWDGRKYSEGRLAVCAGNCGNSSTRFNDPNQFDKILEKANE
jgi:MoaA/NifB/PqqE/SkfB family radical SAM enzyme